MRAETADQLDAPAAATLPRGAALSRRAFLLHGALFGGVGAMGVAGHATMVEPWRLHVPRVRAPIDGLPPSLDGMRIAQLSDTHRGPMTPASAISAAVEAALALRPDIVALTGDYIHHGENCIDEAAELFRPLVDADLRFGVVGVLGNHDWYGNGRRMRAALERVGVRMIDNDRVFADPFRAGLMREAPAADALCIAGVGDLEMDRVNLDAALGGVRPHTPRILLSHNPDVAERLPSSAGAAARVDLMLSGHTHGGQVVFPLLGALWVPSAYGDKYAGGVIRGPRCPVVVSRGVGMSILPVRLNCPPEVVEITLERA